jgi:DNA-binding transcriptional ArsR family regulator
VVSLLEPAAVIAAVCDPTRHAILRLMADGQPHSVGDLAARLGRPADGISKHLRVLRDARLIRAVAVPGTDGRRQFHELPVLFRTRDTAGRTVLDFGAIVLRVE